MKKQMKRTGKFLALVLAGLMAFSSLELSTFAADDVSIQTVSKTVTAELEMPENEELLTGYLEQIFYGNYISTFAVGLNTAGSRLSGDEKLVYDALVPYMKQIAAGSRVSTVITLGHEVNNGVEICPVDTEITFTGTFDDFDLGSVNEALLSDYPYEMYWYDKTVGVTANGYESDAISQITFTFPVASDYQNGDSTTINAAYATAATTAVANADAIITENASNSDYDKLVAYSNKIMELVSYDTNAAQNNTFSSDIDPWQLINVFDGVDTTNVVCEGYSKAFQYLCDKTTFTGDVSCYSVTGTMDGGGHMWNIVTIEDANYLVDVTNSESGTVGQDGTLFLAGTTGSVAGGYTFTSTYDQSIQYIYYDDTIAFWGSDDDSILKLASESYEEEVVCVHEWTSYNADDTANTITAHCSTCEADYLTYTLQLPTENIYTGKVLETAKYVGSTNNIWNSTEPTITYTAKAGSSLTEGLAVNAGEYTVTMSWKGFSVSADYTIGKRSVTVTPKDQTIAVNETADATQITLGGEHNLAEGHNCTVTYAAVDTTSVGTKTLTIDTVTILDANSNDVTGNYNITKQTGTLNVKTHEHVWSYVANEENNTITATCSGSIGTCPDAEQSITLEAPEPASLNYNKSAKTATVTGAIDGVATPSVTYCCDGGCINAGEHTASITVGGKTVSVSFTIAKASVSDASVSVDPWADYTYTGNEIKPSAAVNVGGYSLSEGEDFTLVYTNNIDAGQATVTVTGQGNYEGTKSITYTIKQATASITQNPAAKTGLVYSAGAQDLIEAGATNGGELQYSLDNTNWSTSIPTGTTAKTYTVYYKVVGGKNYKDIAAQNFTVTIGPKEVTAPEFSGLNAQYLHTGSAVEPTFTLKEGQNTIPASEYEVAYSNNTNLGTATITISDVAGGNYTVSGSKTFEIVTHAHVWSYVANEENNTITATCSGSIGTCPDAEQSITLEAPEPASLNYNKSAKTATVTGAIDGVATPSVTYCCDGGCINAGEHTASITVGGKTVSVSFTIAKASVSDASVSVDPWADYTYTGNEIKPSAAVNVGGYSLSEGEDFTLVYTNNIDAGQATVTVTGQGNYEGTKSITYTIKQATASITQNPAAKTGLVYSAGAQDLIEAGATNGGELQYSLDNTNWSTSIPTGTTAKTYTVYYKVVGGKNYKDIAAQNFTVTIGPKEVTAPEFSGLNAQYLHTGSAVEPTFTLKEGQNTIPASEYEVAYSNNTNLGTATITISDVAGGNYTVSGSKTFEIVTHAHVWSYVANEENNTITATCSGSIGTCPVANNKVVITLVSPAGELVYDGTKKPVSVTQSPENVFTDLDDSDIVATNDCVSAGVHSVTLTYGGKSVSATFTIKQKESQYTAPDLLSAIYGNTLADVELPDNFTWQDALTTKVGNVGTNTFKATYTPDDVVNYTTVRDIEIPIKVSAKNITATVEVADGTYIYTGTAITPAVTVKDGSTVISETEYTVNYTDNINAGTATITVTAKNGGNYSFTEVAKTFDIAQADNPPGKPASTLSTSYTNKKIGDITLSTGWEWLEADKDTALEVGESKTATANYTAADKNNYKNLTVVVTVTREACSHSGGNATCTEKATCSVCGKEYGSYGSHGSTEERGVVAATCSANGYSGDSYCKDCGARVSYGYVTAKLQHIYVTVVTKAPTCEETGIQTHTCSNCGDVLTETLLQKGHDYKSEITVEPTVEKEGVRTYTCKVCGHIYTKSIAKLEPEPEKTEPFIKGNNGKEGWDAISKELDDSKKDDIYIIDMNNGSTVPGEVIETVKGKEVIVVFDLGNDITWRVNGKNIAADKIDNIDFGIKVETPDEPLNNIPEDVLKKVKGDRESVDINLAYEGEFGFKAVLSINMGAENAGKYANLFYYNPATKSLDFVCADDVSVDGTATLTFDHASDYTIILDTTSMYNVSTEKEPVDGDKEDEGTVSTETKENEESKPAGDKEADSSSVNELEKNGGGIVWFLVIGGVLLLVIIGVVLVVRKRNNDDF